MVSWPPGQVRHHSSVCNYILNLGRFQSEERLRNTERHGRGGSNYLIKYKFKYNYKYKYKYKLNGQILKI